MQGLTPLHEAQKTVFEATKTLGLEKVSLLDALDRVLGEDIVAARDNPPWDNSAMDGFAVRWEDIKQEHAITKPVVLRVIEDVPAGKVATKSVSPGQTNGSTRTRSSIRTATASRRRCRRPAASPFCSVSPGISQRP